MKTPVSTDESNIAAAELPWLDINPVDAFTVDVVSTPHFFLGSLAKKVC